MNTSLDDRVSKYINTIESINEGQRNNTLYNLGLSLRDKFGLTGDDLEAVLLEVNETKCMPPSPPEDVSATARSVDNSDVLLGEPSTTRTKKQNKKTLTSKCRTEYVVSQSADCVSVVELLEKTISVYPNCKAKTPSGTMTIHKVLEAFQAEGEFIAQIDAVRNETDKDKRGKLKQTIPAVVFGSDPQKERKIAACTSNEIICLDFDHIPVEEIEEAKQEITAVSYVFSVGLSVSGNGLFALAYYDGTPDLKKLIQAMQADFRYEIDKQCSDISRLRFATFDKDLIIKDEVFPAVLIEQTVSDIDESLQAVPFPVECLPPTLAQMARDIQRCINLKDAAMPAISVVVACASAVGSSSRIEIKRGYTEPSSLFTAIVADSGSAKSPSIAAALKHIYALQAEKIKQWKQETYEWKLVCKARKSLPKEDRGDEPNEPQPPTRFIIGDVTIPAVAVVHEDNPCGLLLVRDELNGFLGGMDAYQQGKTDLQSWIEIFEGQGFTVDRKKDGLIQIDNPSVSIIGGVQPEILKQTLNERKDFIHSGFGSRFLFAMPEKEAVVWNMNTPNEEVVSRYEKLIDCIIAEREIALERDCTGINAFAKVNPVVFSLSDDARRVLFGFQERYARQAVFESAANAAAMNKAGRIAARLCLVLHCVRSIEEAGQLQPFVEVCKETAENAVVIADWFMHESERVYAMLDGKSTGGKLTADQQTVMQVLLRRNKPMTSNEIRDSISVKKRPSVADTDEALRGLVSLGEVQSKWREHKDGKGRPTEEYVISEK